MFDRDGWPLPASGKASPPSIGGRMRGGRASTATMPLCEKSLVALALGADPRSLRTGAGAIYFKGGLSTGGGGRIGGIADGGGSAEIGGTTGTTGSTTGGTTGTVVGPTGSASGDDGGSPGVGSIGLMGRDAAAVGAEPSGTAVGGDEVSVEPGRTRAEPALGASAAACCKASSM